MDSFQDKPIMSLGKMGGEESCGWEQVSVVGPRDNLEGSF